MKNQKNYSCPIKFYVIEENIPSNANYGANGVYEVYNKLKTNKSLTLIEKLKLYKLVNLILHNVRDVAKLELYKKKLDNKKAKFQDIVKTESLQKRIIHTMSSKLSHEYQNISENSSLYEKNKNSIIEKFFLDNPSVICIPDYARFDKKFDFNKNQSKEL